MIARSISFALPAVSLFMSFAAGPIYGGCGSGYCTDSRFNAAAQDNARDQGSDQEKIEYRDVSPKQNGAVNQKSTLADIELNDPSFSHAIKYLQAGDMISFLQGKGPFTIFTPNDAAFADNKDNRVLDDQLKPENKARLIELIKSHIVAGHLRASDLKTGQLKSLSGRPIDVKVEGSTITVNNARISKPEVVASNGVLFTIDSIWQQDLQQPVAMETVREFATKHGFRGHSLNRVLNTNPALSTFAKALKAAHLDSCTIFAPSNEAFAKLDPKVLADLLLPENADKLTALLIYHIVPGKHLTTDLKTEKIMALNGDNIDVKVEGSSITINDAKITEANIVTSHGVVQIIDTVLQP